jgi:hypothetical protein
MVTIVHGGEPNKVIAINDAVAVVLLGVAIKTVRDGDNDVFAHR